MSIFKKMAARIRGFGKRGKFSEMVDYSLKKFPHWVLTRPLRLSEEVRIVSERRFKGRTIHGVSRTNDGATLLFIDGTRGDVEACDAVEILKYLD